jgi:hypothetical protein
MGAMRERRLRGATSAALLLAASAISGCAAPRVAAPTGGAPRALWDLAPTGASTAAVMRDGAAERMLSTLSGFGPLPAGTDEGAAARRKLIEPLSSRAGWERAGLDPKLGAAMFGWPTKERGVLAVLPVVDRAKFRATFGLQATKRGAREIDEHESGYVCVPAAGRYLCAKSLDEIDAAAAPHEVGLARTVERLPLDDRGDIEMYGSARAREIARLRERARTLGLLMGVATSIRFRRDGASVRVHVLGDTTTKLAQGLAGAPPPSSMSPAAAGAPTVVRVHFDPAAVVEASTTMDPRVKSEVAAHLTGDVEISTSGAGLFGASLVAPVRDPERVERYVKERCAETGGSMRLYALDKITVTEHGCSMLVDPSMLLIPLKIPSFSIVTKVEAGRLVVLVGEAQEPSAARRAWEAVVDGQEVRRALRDAEALVAFTRSPIVGPVVGAAKAFKTMIPLLNERTLSFLDAWGEVGARIYQAALTARVAPDGIVAWADFTTFAGDPLDARAAHEAALAKRSAGDEARYLAALVEIEQRFPGSRAAKRAASVREGAPYLGAGALFLGMLGSIAGRK